MDSLDDDYDIESALDAELAKYAADYDEQSELEMIKQWQETRDPEVFANLYNVHGGIIGSAIRRVYSSTPLPKVAVQAHAIRHYVNALDTYDPSKGAQFKTHAITRMQGRMGRYANKYGNIGRIGDDRVGIIDLMKSSKRGFVDAVGRDPSDRELYDAMQSAADDFGVQSHAVTPQSVSVLRKELRDDLIAEMPGGQADVYGQSDEERRAIFMHGSLNDEQKMVLEHTYPGWGKPLIESPEELAKQINLSPQKIRAIKAQILRKVGI